MKTHSHSRCRAPVSSPRQQVRWFYRGSLLPRRPGGTVLDGPVHEKTSKGIILVRLRGVLTPAEIKLAKTPEDHSLIKQVRTQLLENSRSPLEEIVQRVTGCSIVSLHSEISVKTGERVIVFTLNQNLED